MGQGLAAGRIMATRVSIAVVRFISQKVCARKSGHMPRSNSLWIVLIARQAELESQRSQAAATVASAEAGAKLVLAGSEQPRAETR